MLCGQRFAEIKSLTDIALPLLQKQHLLFCFDSLGNDLHAHIVPQRDDRIHDAGIIAVVKNVVNEGLVDLQYVDGKTFEKIQRGITGTEIIDGHGNPGHLQRMQNVTDLVDIPDHQR